MSELFRKSPTADTSVFGRDMIIKGTIQSKQDVFLDGQLEGVLDVDNFHLTIGPNGKAIAHTRAREVDIQGAVRGNIETTHKIAIRTGGRLVGDIRTAGIVIEDGAYFKGGVDIVTPRPQPNPAGEK